MLGFLPTKAYDRVDTNGNTVHHSLFAVAQYQIQDFEFAKESGAYGVGLAVTSMSHWGILHVGGNVNMSLNAGLMKPWGMMFDFGPSARIDINKNFLINIPIDASVMVSYPKGEDTKTSWGAKISPALHGFVTDEFGLFVGPQLSIWSSNATIGMVAGLSYSF